MKPGGVWGGARGWGRAWGGGEAVPGGEPRCVAARSWCPALEGTRTHARTHTRTLGLTHARTPPPPRLAGTPPGEQRRRTCSVGVARASGVCHLDVKHRHHPSQPHLAPCACGCVRAWAGRRGRQATAQQARTRPARVRPSTPPSHPPLPSTPPSTPPSHPRHPPHPPGALNAYADPFSPADTNTPRHPPSTPSTRSGWASASAAGMPYSHSASWRGGGGVGV